MCSPVGTVQITEDEIEFVDLGLTYPYRPTDTGVVTMPDDADGYLIDFDDELTYSQLYPVTLTWADGGGQVDVVDVVATENSATWSYRDSGLVGSCQRVIE